MLTLKQARRMVAKSRRRVWRLSRKLAPEYNVIAGDNGLAGYYAETVIPWAIRERRYSQMPGAQEVCAEFLRRLPVLWAMETEHRDRAWARYRTKVDTRIGPDLMEVPEYEMGQGCPVCGAEMDFIECDHCGGEGGRDNDALMEEDPLWYDGVEWESCGECQGKGGWWHCYRAPHEKVR